MNNATIKKHLENFIANNEREEFGCTAILRDCKISYNDAFRVLETGIKNGQFEALFQPYRARMVIEDD